MNKQSIAQERRKQTRLEQLGTDSPICTLCLESDWRCLEQHHIAPRKTTEDCAIVCRNCHRKLSDDQRDHPPPTGSQPVPLPELVGRYLLGLADLFRLLVDALTQFGHLLIDYATHSISSTPTTILEENP